MLTTQSGSELVYRFVMLSVRMVWVIEALLFSGAIKDSD